MGRIIVVGTGFSGSILARRIAEECGRRVEVIEKRSHIGGNMYDEYDRHGILVQRYGPHFLNTNKYWIIEYLSGYADLYPHDAHLLSFIDGEYVQLPFNFRTLQQLVGAKRSERLLEKLRTRFAGRDRVPVFELVDSGDADISEYGTLLFEKAYRTYTAKQWGLLPEEIVSYPQAPGYTRSTEYKKLTYGLDQDIPVSMIATEYPLDYDPSDERASIPYYPVLTEASRRMYSKYVEEAERYGNIVLCGRLAEFRYYNMDVCIEHAFEKFKDISYRLNRAK